MRFLVLFDTFLCATHSLFGVLAATVVDTWNGQLKRGLVRGFTFFFESVVLNAGDTIGPYGWVDLRSCGRPMMQFIMWTYTGYGARDVTFVIDYGTENNGVMEIHRQQRNRDADKIEYIPSVSLFNVRIFKDRGAYARIRYIKNNGEEDILITGRASITMKPLLREVGILDPVVTVGED